MSIIKGNVTVSIDGVNIGKHTRLIAKSEKIKTRLLVHIALNAKGERVNCLVSIGGMLIPFLWGAKESLDSLRNKPTDWGRGFDCEDSLYGWKSRIKRSYGAVRFQRVILEGEAE